MGLSDQDYQELRQYAFAYIHRNRVRSIEDAFHDAIVDILENSVTDMGARKAVIERHLNRTRLQQYRESKRHSSIDVESIGC